MENRRANSGFVLIELVTTIILVGIIGVFTGFFLFTGMQGYFTSKQTSEGALRAQIAADRISKELQDIKSLPADPVTNTSVTYTSNDPNLLGQRRISFSGDLIQLSVDTGGGYTDYKLIDNVDSFRLTWVEDNLDDAGIDEISLITVAFSIDEIGRTFEKTVYLRDFFPVP